MANIHPDLRKAAVLFRSLDSDTAAVMLAQLSPDEASSLRAAIRELGAIDPEEQADIAAEFRRSRPTAAEKKGGVELSLSSAGEAAQTAGPTFSALQPNSSATASRPPAHGRFEFLAQASTSALVAFLSREHAQTIAVVLAHLAAERAAAVLAALPEKLQAETIERLSALGDADPESVMVLERELAAWLATRGEDRGALARRRETVTNILAAADAKTRRGILSKLRMHNSALAEQIEPASSTLDAGGVELPSRPERRRERLDSLTDFDATQAADVTARIRRQLAIPSATMNRPRPASKPRGAAAQTTETPPVAPPAQQPALPRVEFDHLIHLDTPALNALLRETDPNVLAIALVGSHEEFVERICGLMPKRVARAFRRELRKLGPMRLSDVEMAQRAVAETAVRQMVKRRHIQVAAA